MKPHRLLLLVPAHNEEHRIEPVLREYASYFTARRGGDFELVVILNGCWDDTIGRVQRVARDHPCVRWMEFEAPIGKGGALIEGLKLAPSADWIGYVDADGATPPRAFDALVEHADEAECVIGSRRLPGAILHQSQTATRRFASWVFRILVQLLFRMNIRDTQCGAKVIRRTAVEKIHANLCVTDMAFDINLLYSLKRAGCRVLEVPTEWTDIQGSTVALGRTSLTMLLSVVRIRLLYSPFRRWMKALRPLETWLYTKLRAPEPIPPASSSGGASPPRH